jgi:hypothetical protein
MVSDGACPGCGLVLPLLDDVLQPPAGSSASCWCVSLEVAGFEAEHPELLALHQLLVDAYGAQHAGRGSIRLPYSLVGLHLALDRRWSGTAVRTLHGRMGKPRADWPAFERPGALGNRTILDVAEAGARPGSVDGHRRALHEWARSVWEAWSPAREATGALTDRFLRS